MTAGHVQIARCRLARDSAADRPATTATGGLLAGLVSRTAPPPFAVLHREGGRGVEVLCCQARTERVGSQPDRRIGGAGRR